MGLRAPSPGVSTQRLLGAAEDAPCLGHSPLAPWSQVPLCPQDQRPPRPATKPLLLRFRNQMVLSSSLTTGSPQMQTANVSGAAAAAVSSGSHPAPTPSQGPEELRSEGRFGSAGLPREATPQPEAHTAKGSWSLGEGSKAKPRSAVPGI